VAVTKRKVDYVFCLPGHPSSGIQAHSADLARIELARRSGKTFAVQAGYGSDVYSVRNVCLGQSESFLIDQPPFQGMYEYGRMIWIDSDNIVNADNLARLLSHDVDIVAAWYRQYTGGEVSDNNLVTCGLGEVEPRVPGTSKGRCHLRPYSIREMKEIAKQGKLIEVFYAGFGLIAIKQGVFEKIGYPWFEGQSAEWEDDRGRICRRVITEDVGFCMKARARGFKVYVDPAVYIAHEKRVLL